MKRKDMFLLIFLVLCLLVGAFLRLWELEKPIFWQDEAEIALFAKNIMDSGVPNEYYRGIPVYVSPLIKSETILDGMYEYDQRDFREDGSLRYHPFGDMYAVALSFMLFGISTMSARLIFSLFGILSLFVVYKIGSHFYDKRVGLLSLFLQSINLLLILHERQARYYSMAVFGFLSTIYLFYRALETDRPIYYIFGCLSAILLFYVQPIGVIIIAATFFSFETLVKKQARWIKNKKVLMSLLCLVLAFLPYIVLVQPWNTPDLGLNEPGLETRLMLYLKHLSLFSETVLFFPIAGGLLLSAFLLKKSDKFMLLVLLFFSVFISLLTPYTSFSMSIFLPIFPFLFIMASRFVMEIFDNYFRSGINRWLFLAFFLVLMLTPNVFLSKIKRYDQTIDFFDFYVARSPPLVEFFNNLDRINLYKPEKAHYSGWVNKAIEFLENHNVTEEWVFVTFQNPVFLFYSDFNVQSIWPVSESFLNDRRNSFWIVEGPTKDYRPCKYFYHFVEENYIDDPEDWNGKNFTWVENNISFILLPEYRIDSLNISFSITSYYEEKTVSIHRDGIEIDAIKIEPKIKNINLTILDIDTNGTTITFRSDDRCLRPSAVSKSDDNRCLNFAISDIETDSENISVYKDNLCFYRNYYSRIRRCKPHKLDDVMIYECDVYE
jgi:hypothetical protein